jgi:hypothetical protein
MEKEKKKVTDAQKRATAKYEAANYDKILTRFPKGTKERIAATGAESLNSYIISCVLSSLDQIEKQTTPEKEKTSVDELQKLLDKRKKEINNNKDF